jgi:hypothetical protein
MAKTATATPATTFQWHIANLERETADVAQGLPWQ